MTYMFKGLDPADYEPLFDLDESSLAERGIVRMRVDAKPGFPCRITLDEADERASVLLLNHVSRPDPGPYRASHAIFVTEGARQAAIYLGAIPPALDRRILSLRAFDAAGMMTDAMLVQPGEADRGLRGLFADPNVVEVDAHNAVRGCFAARARRA